MEAKDELDTVGLTVFSGVAWLKGWSPKPHGSFENLELSSYFSQDPTTSAAVNPPEEHCMVLLYVLQDFKFVYLFIQTVGIYNPT